MSYLSNNTTTVDAILTKRGRELYSKGQFSITKFALADDEVDYGLYDASHPSGSDYYSTAIVNLPMLEAIPDGSKMMRFKLITLPKGTSTIPIISVGTTQISLRAPYLSYPGQSQTVTPSTVNGLNSTLGYTATLSSTQYVNMIVGQIVPNGGGGIDPVLPTGLGGSGGSGLSLTGFSFILTSKAVPDNNVYNSTLRITGNETGGEVIINISVSRQTIGDVTASQQE